MLCWSFLYFVGQATKDLCRLPRPAFARKVNAAGFAAACRRPKPRTTAIAAPMATTTSSSSLKFAAAAINLPPPLSDNADGTWNGSGSGLSSSGVICLEEHYSAEFGMPSTHAANSLGLPWAVVLWSARSGRCAASIPVLCVLAAFYTASSTVSRLYFGVHSHFDVIIGLCIGIAALAADLIVGAAVDAWILSTGHTAALVIPIFTAVLIAFYPKNRHWKSTPGDTALVMGATAGVLSSAALDAQRMIDAATPSPAHTRVFGTTPPTMHAALLTFATMGARTFAGWSVCLLVRALLKPIAVKVFSEIVQVLLGTIDTSEEEIAASSREGDTPVHLMGFIMNVTSTGRLNGDGDAAPGKNSNFLNSSPLSAELGVRRRGAGYYFQAESGGGGEPIKINTSATNAAAAVAGGVTKSASASSASSRAAAASASSSAETGHAAGIGGASDGLRIKAPPPSPKVVKLPNKLRYAVELPTKLFVYAAVGITATILVPRLHEAMGLRG